MKKKKRLENAVNQPNKGPRLFPSNHRETSVRLKLPDYQIKLRKLKGNKSSEFQDYVQSTQKKTFHILAHYSTNWKYRKSLSN